MHRIFKTLLVLIVAASGEEATDRIDAILSPLADAKSPGMAVLVRKDGHTLFEKGYGVRDLRTLARIDSHTNFRLASFTKQFTAMAIMLLVKDGKLRYAEPISDFFPDFAPYGRIVTIRQLLNHSSGLPDYEDLMDATWTPTHQITDAEVLTLVEHQEQPNFQPGSKWAYSNSGYVLLGLIVAKASHESFAEFLQHRIFEPLKMNHTLVYINGQNSVSNRAFGHSRKDGVFTETDQSSTSATLGDGGIYSNLEDLAKWDDALQNHTLLNEQDMAIAVAPSRVKPYGFGWFLDPYQDHKRMWHTGSTMGFGTVIERFPNDQLTIIVLANRTDFEPEKLALQVADLLLAPGYNSNAGVESHRRP